MFVCLLLPVLAIAQTNTLPPHPRLLLNADGVAQLKQRIATAPWAKASWGQLKSNAAASLDHPVNLPPRGGNWGHNYVCPAHGARLVQGKQLAAWRWEHSCPVGNHPVTAAFAKAQLDFNGNVMMKTHLDYAKEVADQGLVYRITGDERHWRRVRDILIAYADRYTSYAMHDNWDTQQARAGRGGRVSSQSLTEAQWLIDMVLGADLVWDKLAESDRALITEKIFRPALDEIIIPQKSGIHNIQNWLNSAIGLVGFLLDDRKLIDLAIEDPKYGFRQQMAQGVRADGMWLEGASGYHFYALDGMCPLMEAARNCGIDLYGPQHQQMFSGPLTLAMPNLSLPNFNDSGVVSLQDRADLYELAFARYHLPSFAGILSGTSRRGRRALLCGETNLPPVSVSAATGSRNLEASGYAILQQGQGTNATWLALKYGPHGGWHGHPDKNTFILYSRGDVVSPDAGTHAYGSLLHTRWDKTTVAHDTLVVDEQSQASAEGKCLAFGRAGGVDYAVTDAGAIYTNVSFTRSVAMLTPELIVFVDQVRADGPHTFDLAYHQMGAWSDLPAGVEWPRRLGILGYHFFLDTTTRTNVSGLKLATKSGTNSIASIILPAGDPTEVITGYGILKTTEDRVPMVVQRRVAERTAFVWAISMNDAPVTLKCSPLQNAADQRLDLSEAARVEVVSGKQHWTLFVNPGRQTLRAAFPGGASGQFDDVFLVK